MTEEAGVRQGLAPASLSGTPITYGLPIGVFFNGDRGLGPITTHSPPFYSTAAASIRRTTQEASMNFDNPEALTQARFEKTQELKVSQDGYGATDAARALIKRYITDTVTLVSSEMEKLKTSRSKRQKELIQYIGVISADTIAFTAMHMAINNICRGKSLGLTAVDLGRALEHEAYNFSLKAVDEKVATRLERVVRKRHKSLKHRRTALKAIAYREGITVKGWSNEFKVFVGHWLISILVRTPVFLTVKEEGVTRLTLSEEAFEHSQDVIQAILRNNTVFAPLKTRPPQWTSTKAVITVGGKPYGASLIRTKNRKVVDPIVQAAIDKGKMQGVIDALNRIQDVPWTINKGVLEMVEWTYEHGVPCGLPSRSDLTPPPKPKAWEDMDENERRAWKKKAEGVAQLNRTAYSDRTMLQTDLATAKWLGDDVFWTPANMDYRGRVYHLCGFNFQRSDHVRAMFQFADGKPLGPHGLYWLKVHLANCGDFNKVSKASFDDRVKWVDDNLERLLLMAEAPKDDLWWTEADSPFLFLAAAIDLAEALTFYDPANYISHIPVSFDGSCSGLQHLCAMTKAPEGILVNLGHTDKTNDIYAVVAEVTKKNFEAEVSAVPGDHDKARYAKMALDFGVNRSFVKRQVMTYAYSSKAGGMKDQLIEDFMVPLQYEVWEGKRASHPFGDHYYKAAAYIATVIYKSIQDVVQYPEQAMRFLQRIASTMAHESKHLVWTTPLGLPVVLRYPEQVVKRYELFLSDFNICVNLSEDGGGISKSQMRNAVAPCFVHSFDACHLQMVVLKANTDVALVHDSFGCHAGEAEDFRPILTDTFADLYSDRDPLKDVLKEACAQIDNSRHRMPELFQYGTLDINNVRHAQYAFA